MDLNELFMGDEFSRYRRAMVQNIIDFIGKSLFTSNREDLIEIKGALKLARRLIQLPSKMSSSDGVRSKTMEDLNRVQAQFVIQHLVGEKD